jgi:hypothetical protein
MAQKKGCLTCKYVAFTRQNGSYSGDEFNVTDVYGLFGKSNNMCAMHIQPCLD